MPGHRSGIPPQTWRSRSFDGSGAVSFGPQQLGKLLAVPSQIPDLTRSANMKYRGIEYGIVEGTGGHMWRWSTLIGVAVKTGQAHSKKAAIVAAEKAIDRALALKKVRLVPPERSD
jgi:hypothetical protein